MSFTVAPGFLVAMPTLNDPNFFRAVVLMCAHTREGAFGLVVNQPLELPVAAICEEAEVGWGGDHTQVAFCGGPVERQRGWLLHPSDERYEGSQLVDEGLAITTSRDGLAAYGRDPDGPYRLVLGYAGWGPAQLDQEILHGAWLTAPLSPPLIFETPRQDLWRTVLASVGVDPANLVDAGTQLN